MTLTKSDIDGLVEGIPTRRHEANGREVAIVDWAGAGKVVWDADLRRVLYLAAGLTAEGERKSERVRLWIARYGVLPPMVGFEGSPEPYTSITRGTFVPDGAEG